MASTIPQALLVFLLTWNSISSGFKLPAKDFYRDRELLLKLEDNQYLGADLVLDSTEEVANIALMALKDAELANGFQDSFYPPSQSFFLTKPQIESSEVYSFLKGLPKGGALHTHDISIASIDWVIANITYNDNLYICQDTNPPTFAWLSSSNATSCSLWIKVNDLRNQSSSSEVDEYLKKLLVINVKNPTEAYPDLNAIWTAAGQRFEAISQIVSYEPAFRSYYRRALEEFLEDNVQYIETRTVLSETVYGGLDFCCPLSQLEVGRTYMEVAQEFRNDHFLDTCGARMIFAPSRKVTQDTVDEYLQLVNELLNEFPNFFIGFDLVGQEDPGRPLIDFADQILNASAENPNLNFFFHAGETNWQGQSTDLNIIDALLLGAKRLGHGYAILKHPEAQKLALENNVALEVNPISNQVLGLVSDLRNHPASPLIQAGFPLVISSDDPAIWDADPLSHDFYEAFMALASRTMDLKLIKKLVENSITFSRLDDSEKSQCQSLVESKWKAYMESWISKNAIVEIF